MRNPKEIAFRVRQEATNLFLLARPAPKALATPQHLSLPDGAAVAASLSGTEFAKQVIHIAEGVLSGQLPVFGSSLTVEHPIQWRRDYQHRRESPAAYFRRIKYLDFASVGDHKFIWEINRHQHWVTLAQAFLFTRDAKYLREIESELHSWLAQNPFQRGVNWASALEVAFRAISWIWTYHLVGNELAASVRQEFLTGLRQHGQHLAANLSIYFSPNTHLLGEAVALYAIGKLFSFPECRRWARLSQTIVLDQLQFQVKRDGSHFEQSSYYHVYALDFFVWFYLLAGRPSQMEPTLIRMADYLSSHLVFRNGSRAINFFGDDDGGRLFHPYGDRYGFGRASLATCSLLFSRNPEFVTPAELAQQAAWWLGPDCLKTADQLDTQPPTPRHYRDSGMVFLHVGPWAIQFDAGPFGYGGAGHSHADTLSFCMQHNGIDALIDSGTFTYIRDLNIRNRYRGTSAHNTVAVRGIDQGTPLGPFRWSTKPEVKLAKWGQTANAAWIDASCSYLGICHRRRVLVIPDSVVVIDEIESATPGIEPRQHWHFGASRSPVPLRTNGSEEWISSPWSPAYGAEMAGTEAVISFPQTDPTRVVTAFGSVDSPLMYEAAAALFESSITN